MKLSIAQLVGVLAKFELRTQSWPELAGFLQTLMTSAEALQRLLGMYTMAVLCETAGEEIKPVFGQFAKVSDH